MDFYHMQISLEAINSLLSSPSFPSFLSPPRSSPSSSPRYSPSTSPRSPTSPSSPSTEFSCQRHRRNRDGGHYRQLAGTDSGWPLGAIHCRHRSGTGWIPCHATDAGACRVSRRSPRREAWFQ